MRIFIFIVLIFSFSLTQDNNINAGPTVGYSHKIEVALWIQTNTEADVKFLYWDINKPNQIFETEVNGWDVITSSSSS